MKTMPHLFLGTALLLFALADAPAAIQSYNGNGDTSGGGPVGLGQMTWSDNGTTVFGTFTRGVTSADPDPAVFSDSLVFFFDSVPGGLHDTTTITETGGGTYGYAIRSISGRSNTTSDKSSVVFADGFYADYALVIDGNRDIGSLFRLNNDGSLQMVRTIASYPQIETAPTFQFSFLWSDIGQTGSEKSMNFESTYIRIDGKRYVESFEGMTGSVGWATNIFTSYHSFPQADPVPEMTNSALAIFGGVVGVAGLAKRWQRRRGR